MRKINISLQQLSLLVLCSVMLASCADIDIVKRRYRPGYHIDITKKKEKPRPAESTAKVEEPKKNPSKRLESKKPDLATYEPGAGPATASSAPLPPSTEATEKNNETNAKKDRHVKRSDFRWSAKKKKRHAKKPMFSANDHWSAWVIFFSGAAGAVFGLISLIVSFVGVVFWPTALVLSVVAIVFAIIHMSKGWSGQTMRKWGLILGIVGLGLSIIAAVIWAIWIAGLL